MLDHGYRLAVKGFNLMKKNLLLFLLLLFLMNFVVNFPQLRMKNFSITITSNDDVEYNDSVFMEKSE